MLPPGVGGRGIGRCVARLEDCNLLFCSKEKQKLFLFGLFLVYVFFGLKFVKCFQLSMEK